jgi:hypothetical protein
MNNHMNDPNEPANPDAGSHDGHQDANASMVEGPAIVQGAVLAFAIVIPAAIVQLLVSNPSIRLLLFGIVLAGFGAGGYRAADHSRTAPLTSAALAAMLAFVAAQAIAVTVRLTSGRPITWAALAFLAMLATSCAMVGAWIRLRRSPVGDT